MKRVVWCIAIIATLLTTGCRGFYEGFKAARSEECYRLSYPAQQECLQQIDISYEEYEKEREKKKRGQ